MGFLPAAKIAAQVVAGLGVSQIVSDIVARNVMLLTTTQKVTVRVGTFVLTSMLVEQSSNHINRTTDEVVDWYEKRKLENETKK